MGNKGAFLSFQSAKKKNLDVWLVDALSPLRVTNITDTTSLFMLQLASIVQNGGQASMSMTHDNETWSYDRIVGTKTHMLT